MNVKSWVHRGEKRPTKSLSFPEILGPDESRQQVSGNLQNNSCETGGRDKMGRKKTTHLEKKYLLQALLGHTEQGRFFFKQDNKRGNK